jgi:hypothetical protein
VEQTSLGLVSSPLYDLDIGQLATCSRVYFCASAHFPGNQGDEVFSADDKSKTPPRTSGDQPPRKSGAAPQADRNIGDALRRVYQDAAGEDVPDDLLDLLRKLD